MGEQLLPLVVEFIILLVFCSTGIFLLTIPLMRDVYQFWRVRGTKRYQVAKFARILEQMLDNAPTLDDYHSTLAQFTDATQAGLYPVAWRSENFIKFLEQMDFELADGNIVISRPEFGVFLLPLTLEDVGFNLKSKPLWVPKFCLPGCTLVLGGEVPFNACLITQLKGYATQKFTPREIEIISIALFLRDGTKQEILTRISEGSINIRFPNQCQGCRNLQFIRKPGPGDLPDRPEIEIN
jgi:hypothetical protein